PLGRPPSLCGLRCQRFRAGFVRPLRWYYEAVRLPTDVHVDIRPLAFFDRPTLDGSVGVCRASRFPRMELPHMPRVSGREKKSPEPHSGSILGEQLNPEQESEQKYKA